MELLPCPFCGAIPEVDNDGEIMGTVECCSSICPVNPSVQRDHEPGHSGTVLAIDAWNARAKPAPFTVKLPVRRIYGHHFYDRDIIDAIRAAGGRVVES